MLNAVKDIYKRQISCFCTGTRGNDSDLHLANALFCMQGASFGVNSEK